MIGGKIPPPADSRILKPFAAIAGSNKPCIYFGGGIIFRRICELRTFMESHHIPAVSSPGVGAIPYEHPLFDLAGDARRLFANYGYECDLL